MKNFDRDPGNTLCIVLSAGLIGLSSFLAVPAADAQLIISEFRVRGPSGANDEFIEIYNNSGADHTVAGGGTGYGVAASDGVALFVIPMARSFYQDTTVVNSVAYSLASYPAGNGTTATGDATYVTDIPDNAGIAIFNTSIAVNFILANRLDAVGSTSEANTLYKEGTGYPALTPFSIDYAFYRDTCGKAGSITTMGPCSISTPHRQRTTTRTTSSRRYQWNVPRRGRAAARCAGRKTSLEPHQRRLASFAVSICSTRAWRRPRPEPRPRLHLRPGEQLHLRHPRHPPHGDQQHGRKRHAAALVRHRPDDLPRAVGHRRHAASHLHLRRRHG